ncbi:fucolectin-like isoform 2-T8 [Vipera latastei]
MKVLFLGCLLAVTLLAGPALAQSCKPLPKDVVGKNLALKKPAQQSSTSNDGSPDKAVDGKCIGEWSKGSCTHTKHERNPWWLVDLGESRKIYAVMVKNRKDCCGQRLYEAEIHVGDSRKDNGRVNYLCDIIQNDNPGSLVTIYCDGHQGRYVSVHLPRDDALTLCEVEVYGTQ